MNKLNKYKKIAAFLISLALMPGSLFCATSSINAMAADTVAINEGIDTEHPDDQSYIDDSSEIAEEYVDNELKILFNEDYRFIKETSLKYYIDNYYYKTTGIHPAQVIVDMPYDSFIATIKLIDENNEVLDIFTHDLNTYTVVTNQNGDEYQIDDDIYYRNEDELIAPYQNLYDAAQMYFFDNSETENISFIPYQFYESDVYRFLYGKDMMTIIFFDDEYNTLAKYIIDAETGVGTDSNENVVNLTPYLDPDCYEYCRLARKDFQEKYGEQILRTYFTHNNDRTYAIIYVTNINVDAYYTYYVDLTAGVINSNDIITSDQLVYDDGEFYDPSLDLWSNKDYKEIFIDYYKYCAERTYLNETGNSPADITVDIPDKGFIFTITFTDEDNNLLETYTINHLFRNCTDRNGNTIKLDISNTSLISEDSLFAPLDFIYDSALSRYIYGNESIHTPVYYIEMLDNNYRPTDETGKFLTILLIGKSYQTIEKYVVDSATGIGSDSNGNTVDLSTYYKESKEKSYCNLVREDYKSKNGEQILFTHVASQDEQDHIFISLLDKYGNLLDEYTIEQATDIAETQSGNTVDLSDYYKKISDNELFVPLEHMCDVAIKHFNQHSNTEIQNYYIYFDEISGIAQVLFNLDDDYIYSIYKFDMKTGIGKDDKGNVIDLSAYADEYKSNTEIIDESEFFAPHEELCSMAVKDYEKKTGLTAQQTEYTYDNTTKTAKITLEDTNDNTLEVYSIDPVTGLGTTSAGEVVDLPKTGMSCAHKVLTGLAVLMTLTGISIVKKNRKEIDE